MGTERLIELLLSCILICLACNQVRTREDLQGYVLDPDNGRYMERTIGRIDMSVAYRPSDLLVAQSLGEHATAGELDGLRKGFGQYDYFVLSMSADKKEIETYALQNTAFGERVQTLAFGMGEYVRIVTDQSDTIPVADYFYQRTYGIGKTSDFLMAFNAQKLRKSQWFRLQVSDFGLGIGDQQFKFQTKNLKTVPRLDMSDFAK